MKDWPTIPTSALFSDTEILLRMGYVKEIDLSIGRMRVLAIIGLAGLRSFAKKIADTYGVAADGYYMGPVCV